MTKTKLCPVALGLSLGTMWGLVVFIMGLLAYFYTYGKPFVASIAALYLGYEPSVLGSIVGGIIGFIDAFIGGFILGWLYNMFLGCKKGGTCSTEKCE